MPEDVTLEKVANVADKLSTVAILLLIVVGGIRAWYVFGWLYQEKIKEFAEAKAEWAKEKAELKEDKERFEAALIRSIQGQTVSVQTTKKAVDLVEAAIAGGNS